MMIKFFQKYCTLNRGIRTVAKLRLLTKIELNVIDQSREKNLPKIANSRLKHPPKICALPGLNFGSTATLNSDKSFCNCLLL